MADAGTNETTSSEIDAIKDDIQKLRDDLGSLLSNIGSLSREKLADAQDRLSAAIGAFEGRAYGRMQGTAHMMRDRGSRAVEVSRSAVEQKPMTYLALAFAVGVVIASLFERKKT